MEVPLTPLEFARRARRLYAEREAVIDGSERFTYGRFFERCDRWSSALQALGVSEMSLVTSLDRPRSHTFTVRSWLAEAVERDSAKITLAERAELDRVLDLYHWFDLYRPELRLTA